MTPLEWNHVCGNMIHIIPMPCRVVVFLLAQYIEGTKNNNTSKTSTKASQVKENVINNEHRNACGNERRSRCGCATNGSRSESENFTRFDIAFARITLCCPLMFGVT